MWSTGCKERVGQQASWGLGVPTPGCVRQRGSKATTRAGRRAECSLLTNSGVLGSPPWLFEHLLANQEGTGTEANKSSLKTPKKSKSKAGQTRDVNSALPT